MRAVVIVLILILSAGCGNQLNENGSSIPIDSSVIGLNQPACIPTDQDRYVWRASRLQFVQTCIRASGTVIQVAAGGGADGDVHIDLRVDPPYEGLVNGGNQKNEGYLMVEAVCQIPPPMMEALRICASDPDPYVGPFPKVGDHVWMEGRYVLDLQHYSWAELHPLYRWGRIVP